MKTRWMVPAAALGAAVLLVYCGRDEPGGIPVSSQQNQPPVIRSIVVDPPSIAIGGTAKVTVDAADPDGEALQMSWTSASGSSIAGDREATYTHDGSSITSDTITATVVDVAGG